VLPRFLKKHLFFLIITGFYWGAQSTFSQTIPNGQKIPYYDIYLTNNQICKSCTVQQKDLDHVWLINKQGHYTVVSRHQIMGLNQHPVVRRVLWASLHGIGLPGPIIAPEAFEKGNEFVCKYCDKVNY
jgi:hypothetical protein